MMDSHTGQRGKQGQMVKLQGTDHSGRRPVPEEKRPVLVSATSGETGMVAEGEVRGIRIKFLIDTGPAITLISRVVFESINDYNMEELYKVPFEVWLANGNKLQVMGGSKMKITLGSKQLMQDVVVADIKAEGILGMDFLGNHQCILNVAKSEMKLDGDNIPLTVEGLPVSRCCRITTMENEVVPPEQEMLIRGKLVPNGPSGNLYITDIKKKES